MAGGHAQGFLPVLHHTDVAAFDLFFDLDLHDTAFLQLLFAHAEDPLGLAAGYIDGAKSILTGIGANLSMQTGEPVNVQKLIQW